MMATALPRSGPAAAKARHGRRAATEPTAPSDPRHPGDGFLAAEIDADRRSEWWLIPKAVLAFAIVVGLVVLREVYLR